MSFSTLAESPTYAIVNGRSVGSTAVCAFTVGVGGGDEESKRCACSWSVRRSARICVGCQSEDKALRTGTGEYFASSWVYAQNARTTWQDSTYFNFRVITDSGEDTLAHSANDAGSVTR
jgi:hypothetical protein